MKAIISVLLIVFTAHITAQSIAVNTTELCTSYRYLVSWDLGSLPEGRYTVDSPSILTAIAEYNISSAQATGSRYNYLLLQPSVQYTVTLLDAQDRKWNSTTFARASGCTNLPTYGKTLGEQATLVLDHYRTQVKDSYRIYRHPKLERLAELLLSTGSNDIAYFLTLLSPVPDWYSYELIQTKTDADAGSLIQILLDTPASYLTGEKIPAPNTNIMREIGFAYNATQQTWLVVLTNRTSIKCGNGLLDASEACDDGNRDDYDGCSSACQIEAGWSCPDDVLQSGSICVTTPSYVPLATPDQGSNPNSPSPSSNPSDNTPSGSNSPSGGNNPSNGSPSGQSNSPSTQQTSGSSKIEVVAVMIASLIALLY